MSAAKISDSRRARQLLEIYRGETDDFFKLWPTGKRYFFDSGNKAFIAYGLKYQVAVCMGGPAGREQSVKLLMSEFKNYCTEHHLTAAFIQTTAKYNEIYPGNGFRSLLIGADAVVDIDSFYKRTVHNKYFRNIVNRFEKGGFIVKKYKSPHSAELLKDLKRVSDSWLKLPHRKEWSFLTGCFDNDYLQQVNLYVLRDKKGIAQAFANETPTFKPGVATIDLMRHMRDSPPNSIDYLFIRMMLELSEAGYDSFNIGMSPLDGKHFAVNFQARLLLGLYGLSENFIGFRGLHQFKAKYQPKWEPRYVWYQGGPLKLPHIGLAIYQLMKHK